MKKIKNVMYIILISICMVNYLYAPFDIFDRPGEYVVGLDLEYSPTFANDSIFVIASDNVTLNLNNHVIEQASGNTQPLNGIVINANLEDITIKNGVVGELTGTGIIINSGCGEIVLEKLSIDGCATRGIAAIGTAASPIGISMQDIACNNCGAGSAANAVCFFQNIRGFNFTSLVIAGGGSATHSIDGLRMDQCAGGRLDNCVATALLGRVTINGFNFSECSKIIFNSCFSGNHIPLATNTTINSYLLQPTGKNNSNALQFDSCIARGNTTSIANCHITGFSILDSSTDNIITNCTINDNTATSSVIGIFFQNNRDNIVENCIISGNKSTGSFAYGCYVLSCTGISVIDSSFTAQATSSGGSIAVGVFLQASADCVFRNNTVIRNNATTDANSFGFRVIPPGSGTTPPVGNNVFLLNISVRNGPTAPVTANQFSGFASGQQSVVTNEAVNSITPPWTNPGFT